MGKDSKARGPEVFDREDSLWLPGQLSSSAGRCGQREDFPPRRPRVHDSVGGRPRETGSGSSKKTLVQGQSWLAMESMASGRDQGGHSQRDSREIPIR